MSDFAFDSKQTGYSGNNALACALASQLAYSAPDVIAATAKGWGFTRVVPFESDLAHGYAAGNDDMVLVAFRGTDPSNLKDWMTDMDAEPVGFLTGVVHLGFLRSVRSVWDQVTGAIATLQTRGQSIWFTGHSLGAAQATVAVAKLRLEQARPVHGLYTYGSPRVGDGALTQSFDQDFAAQTFRFVNDSDVVTRVPMREPFGYRHCGTLMFFDENGVLQTDVHFWNQFVDILQGDMDAMLDGKVAPLDCHFIANYVDAARANRTLKPF
jgi:triacylglycerol lipase